MSKEAVAWALIVVGSILGAWAAYIGSGLTAALTALSGACYAGAGLLGYQLNKAAAAPSTGAK